MDWWIGFIVGMGTGLLIGLVAMWVFCRRIRPFSFGQYVDAYLATGHDLKETG